MPCRDVIPFTIERRALIFGAGTLISPELRCSTVGATCCGPDDDGVANGDGPACCTKGFLTQIAAVFEGRFEQCDLITFISLDLFWDENLQAYGGESPSFAGHTLVAAVWCADQAKNLWEGVVSWYFEGEFVASFNLALTPDSGGGEWRLIGKTIVPSIGCAGDVANTVSYSFEYPCDAGETVSTACGNVPVNAYAHITNVSGCACLAGDYPLVFTGGAAYQLASPTTVCGGPLNIGATCGGGGTWMGAIGCATGGTPTAPTSTSTTPFQLTFNGIVPGATCCSGTVNMVINTLPT